MCVLNGAHVACREVGVRLGMKPDRNIDVEAILRDVFDFEGFSDNADDELFEEQLDKISAAGNYAIFLSRLKDIDDETNKR